MSKDSQPDNDDYYLTILKNKLAKGEITIEEFDRLKEKLAQTNYSESARKEIASLTEKVDKLQTGQLEIQKKSTSVTLVLSALCGLVGILGVGHFYTGNKKGGTAFLLPGLFLVLVILLLVLSPAILPHNPGVEQLQQKVVGYYFTILYGLVYLGLYFVQIFDGQRSCRKYNLSVAKTNSLNSQQIASNRARVFLAVVLGILVIISAATANDLSQNMPKLRSLPQEQQAADQQNQNSQTLSGYSRAYENWRQCAQNAGNSYLSVCGNPPPSPFANQPVDCSLASNHWLCNPYYTENNGGKNSVTNASQTLQTIPASSISNLKGDTAIIATKYGNITIKLFNGVAPKTVANFENLTQSGFYDGLLFHRIILGFVIQAGDPNTRSGPRNTWGTGSSGYTIPPEFNDYSFTKYTIGMARGSDVNSGSSQFFITVGDASFLNGKYTLFGQVIAGQDVVNKIASLQINSDNQPVDSDSARIVKIAVQK